MRLTHLFAAIPALVAVVSLSACVSKLDVRGADDDTPAFLQDSERWGAVVRDTLRDLAPFESIDLSGAAADIYYEQSPTACVVVETNEKVLGDYSFTVRDGTFCVKNTKKNLKWPHPTILVHVYAPTISRVEVNGTGDVKLREPVSLQGDLSVEVQGTGDVDIKDLTCGRLEIRVKGTGDVDINSAHCASGLVKITGTGDVEIDHLTCTGDMVCTAHGTGDADIADLVCRNLDIEVTGMGDIQAHVDCDTITASATGTGDMELSGKAKRLEKSEGGLSKIRSRELSVSDVRY